MMAGPHRRDGEAGFTLVELLVALTLMSFLGVALFGSLRFGVLAWERGTAHADGADQILMAQSFLRQAIGEAYPMDLREDPPRVDFEGSATSLIFLTSSAASLGDGGRARMVLSSRTQQGRTDLVISARPELAAQSSDVAGRDRTLIPEIQRLQISYFGVARGERSAAWHETWTHQLTLPQLVRIKVAYAPKDVRLWPDFLVAPRISVDVGCVHDALTKRCRGR